MSVYYNQPVYRTGYTTKATTPVVSPVTAQELADWLRLDDAADPVLNGILIAATSFVIERLQSELINRARTVSYQHWPTVGRFPPVDISRGEAAFLREIKLPYAALQSVELVNLYGEAFTDYDIQQTTPATIYIDAASYLTDQSSPAIYVEYTAGYGADATAVPEAIKTGITMLAAFIYEHRGACDALNAFNSSGAREALIPYMNEAVVF